MLLWISLVLFIILLSVLFYTITKGKATKEGMETECSSDSPNETDEYYAKKDALKKAQTKNSIYDSDIFGEDLVVDGTVSLFADNKLELGKGTKNKGPSSGTLQYKNDTLQMIGGGKDGTKNKIKMYDDVEVNNMLNVNNMLKVNNNIQTGAGGIEFAPELTAQGKKEGNAGKIVYNGWGNHLAIVGATQGNPKESKPRKVHIFDELSVGMDTKVGGRLTTSAGGIEFAPELFGQKKKQVDAGKIVYNGFGTDALSIVGAGLGPRKVKLWDNVEVNNLLKVNNNIQTGAGGIEFAPELTAQKKKEVNAGKIVYNGFGSDALAIVGAGLGPRNVKMWDNVEVVNNTTVGGNLTVSGDATTVKNLNITGDLTIGTPNNKWIITARQGDNNNKWLEFLHQTPANRNNYNDNVGHIIMSPDGNLWIPRSTGKGWVADNIGDLRNNMGGLRNVDNDLKNADNDLRNADNDIRNNIGGLRNVDTDLKKADTDIMGNISELKGNIGELKAVDTDIKNTYVRKQ